MVIFSGATLLLLGILLFVLRSLNISAVDDWVLDAGVSTALACGIISILIAYKARPTRARHSVKNDDQSTYLRAFAEALSVPTVLLRRDELVFANSAFLEQTRWSENVNEVIGKPFSHLVHPLSLVDLSALLQGAREGVVKERQSLRILYPDGSVHVHTVTVLSGHSHDSTLLQLPSVRLSHDEQRNEALLQQYSRDLVANIPLAVFRVDREMNLVFVNSAWRGMMRVSEGVAEESPLWSFFHPDERDAMSAKMSAMLNGHSSEIIAETRLIRSDETLVHGELRCHVVTDDEGKVVGVVGGVIDISSRWRNEESLRASGRSMQTLVANLRAMIYRGQNDRRWSWDFLSEGSFELTGYEASELLGDEGMSFVQLIHPDDREFVWNEVQARLMAGEPYELTYRLVDRSGATKWIWDQGRGIVSARGEVIGVEGFIIEITRRRLAEESAHRRLVYERSTGLTNMSLFIDRVSYAGAMARRTRQACAVFIIRVLDLNELGTRFAQDYVDRVLLLLGSRLQVTESELNCAALLDKQEFAVFITEFGPGVLRWLPNAASIRSLVEQDVTAAFDLISDELKKLMQGPIKLDGLDVSLDVNVGWAQISERILTAQELIDMALKAVDGEIQARRPDTR
ncbi:PAS domain S-box-containing protein [Paraburkholderia fungorum]|uniref:PAS domain-containing protein n=1 Tax=Paraburkholderia fungorum TaxID=134537 RepID=UPI000D4B51B5|nr:PAS domain-containing protein [Paraburkholderia fungorum]PRZ55845.1 PAS domain S-box-containing protein [Paraburkholderia fungorum]